MPVKGAVHRINSGSRDSSNDATIWHIAMPVVGAVHRITIS
jgi:hypothetical protein